METIGVPYRQDELIPGFTNGVPVEHKVIVDLPEADARPHMGVLYEKVARVVSTDALPLLVVSGACLTSLGVIAGLQRSGRDLGIVCVDAHED
jgi:arginase